MKKTCVLRKDNLEYGIVKMVDLERDFGFVTPFKEGSDLYFKASRCRPIVPGKCGEPLMLVEDEPERLPQVEVGQRIVFIRNNHSERPMVWHWGSRKLYEKALENSGNPPDTRTFRVIVTRRLSAGKPIKVQGDPVVVQGTLRNGLAEFANHRGLDGDRLGAKFEAGIGGGKRAIDHQKWQVRQGDDWVDCKDPRPRVRQEAQAV